MIHPNIQDKKIITTELIAIVVDGTVVNTGAKNGIIRQLELHFGRPLHWFICQLHAYELPLRHLFHYLDGKTTEPSTFNGPIGQMVNTSNQLPVVNFQPIESSIPDMSKVSLSSDQDYLFQIVQAVSTGKCSVSLENKYPGNK